MAGREDPQHGLGAAVRQLRGEMTQEDLAHRSEIHPTWISRIESGRMNPTWGTARRIAAGLDVPMGELATLAEELEQQKGGPA